MMNLLVALKNKRGPEPFSRLERCVGSGIIAGLLALVSGCATFDEWARAKVYRPTSVATQETWASLLAVSPEAQTLFVPVGNDGDRIAVLRVSAQADGVKEGSTINVLYLHGTFRHAAQNLPKTVPMAQAGMTVFVPDYRGWGLSTARLPSEASIKADAWTVWQALQKTQPAVSNAPATKWVIYGHSMGSAVAVALAARLKNEGRYCALVLESSFTNFSDVAFEAAGWPGRWLVSMGSQRMDASALIGSVSPPVWFLHGEKDHTTPIALGKRLFEQAPEPKHWAQWPLGHSNLHTDPTGRYDQTWRKIGAHCEQS